MKTIVLVGCGKLKLPHAAPAKDLYIGPLFTKARAYAELVGDEWAILSAKHGLVLPNTVIEPYDETMDQKTQLGRVFWGNTVLSAISKRMLRMAGKGEFVRFICLAGEPYLDFWTFEPDILKFCVIEKPMEGLGMGERLHFLLEGIAAAKASRPKSQSQGTLF